MRAVDAWAIEEQGVPSLDLMERAGLGPRARRRPAARRTGRSASWSARATTAATGWWPRGCCARTGHEVDVLAVGAAGGAARRRPRRTSSACPARRREPFEPERARRAPARSSTRCSAPASRARRASRWRARSRRSTPQDAPVVACDVPSGVNASSGEVEGEAVRADATATFHGSKIGLHVSPARRHAGRGGGGRDRRAARRARAASAPA